MDKIDTTQTLEAGQYWRATASIDQMDIHQDMVLLVESIKWVDGSPHTIILRAHPLVIAKLNASSGSPRNHSEKYQHKLLIKEFLLNFVYEPDYERIRQEELASIQKDITDAQQELAQAQQDPEKLASIVMQRLALDSDGSQELLPLPAPSTKAAHHEKSGDLAEAIGKGVTETSINEMKSIAERQVAVAQVQQEWFSEKTEKIANRIAAMTPFYEEQAAAAIAKTESVTAHIDKMKKGIESLDLYLGKGVSITTLKQGESAPFHAPLTFVQQKLVMDEELAVWADVDESFDFTSTHIFEEKLANSNELVNQIFPSERCVVAMAATRRFIDYGDLYRSIAMSVENWKVCLLVRDGENLYRVNSPVESHLGAHRLFPTRDEHNQVFRGLDGKNVNFDDIAYTDKLSDHDAMSLHYKRFLILMCGLDHQHRLFGRFYHGDSSINFISLEFQREHCQFIHDDDADYSLPLTKPLGLERWTRAKNSMLHKGATVLVRWSNLLTPGRCSKVRWSSADSLSLSIPFSMDSDVSLQTVVLRKGKLAVTPTVRFDTGKTGKITVYLESQEDEFVPEIDFLCIDYIKSTEIRPYIFQREQRTRNFQYLQFLKLALRAVEEREPARVTMEGYIKSKLPEDLLSSEIHNDIFCAWAASLAGGSMPDIKGIENTRAGKRLLKVLSIVAKGPDIHHYLMSEAYRSGREILRVAATGSGALISYEAPAPHERCDEIEPHTWVFRVERRNKKGAYEIASESSATLMPNIPTEISLWQGHHEGEWINATSCFSSLEEKQNALESVKAGGEVAKALLTQNSAHHFDRLVDDYRVARDALTEGRMRNEPGIAIPIGIKVHPKRGEWEYVCIVNRHAVQVLHHIAPTQDEKNRVRQIMSRGYAQSDKAKERFDSIVEAPSEWLLRVVEPNCYSVEGTVYSSVGGFAVKKALLRTLEDISTQISEETSEDSTVWVNMDSANDSLQEILLIGKETWKNDVWIVAHYKVDETTTCGGRYKEWCDLIPKDIANASDFPSPQEWASITHENVNGVTLISYSKPIKERAIGFMQELSEGLNKKLHSSDSLKDAPRPPSEALRYYLL